MNRRTFFLFFALIYFAGYLLAMHDFHEANVRASFFSSTFTAFEGIPQAAARAGERRLRVVTISEPKAEPEKARP